MSTTFLAKEKVERKWYLVDATDKTLGRLATKIAALLSSKNSVKYTPHTDSGNFVIVINAEKVRLTGRKWRQKTYWRHSGYPGGIKITDARDMPKCEIVEHAIKGMLATNKLRDRFMARLKVVSGAEHKYSSQKPVTMNY